jgi:hypothetical protein
MPTVIIQITVSSFNGHTGIGYLFYYSGSDYGGIRWDIHAGVFAKKK